MSVEKKEKKATQKSLYNIYIEDNEPKKFYDQYLSKQ